MLEIIVMWYWLQYPFTNYAYMNSMIILSSRPKDGGLFDIIFSDPEFSRGSQFLKEDGATNTEDTK